MLPTVHSTGSWQPVTSYKLAILVGKKRGFRPQCRKNGSNTTEEMKDQANDDSNASPVVMTA